MTDKETLIENWTRCLDDNAEEQIHAQTMLAENIVENAASLPALVAQMQGVTEKSRKMRRRIMGSLAILAILLCLSHISLPVQLRNLILQFNDMPNEVASVRTTTPEDELLLYGDQNRSGNSLQMRALWESDPRNPAYFADYSRHYIEEHDTLPPDFLEIAADIDHDNAWFTYAAAAVTAKNAVKKGKAHPLSPVDEATHAIMTSVDKKIQRNTVIYQYEIVDVARAQQALDLWRRSLRLSRFESYEVEMHQKRYPLFHKRNHYIGQLPPLMYMISVPVLKHTTYLDRLLVGHLQSPNLGDDEKKLFLQELNSHLERLIETQPSTLVEALLLRRTLLMVYRQQHVVDLSTLDLRLASVWKKRCLVLEDHDEELRILRGDADRVETLEKHGSGLCRMLLPAISQQSLTLVPLTEDNLAPLRYAEHVFLLRLAVPIMSAFFVLLIPYHLLLQRRKPIIRVADEAWHSIPWSKLSRWVLVSVFIPLFYVVVLVVVTPLTGKEFGVTAGVFVPLYPTISVMVILLILPRLLVHRMTQAWENPALNIPRWHLRVGWFFLLLAAVPLHTIPWLFSVLKNFQMDRYIALIFWMPAIVWMLWNYFKNAYARNPYQRITHVLRRRVVAISSIGSIFALCAAAEVLQKCETYWINKDLVLAIHPNLPTAGNYEAAVTEMLFTEIHLLLSADE